MNKRKIIYGVSATFLIGALYASVVMAKGNFPSIFSNKNLENSPLFSGENIGNIIDDATVSREIDLSLINDLLPYTVEAKTHSGELYSNTIAMGPSEEYALVEGISTFRGNNYRDSAFYGELAVTEEKLDKVWTRVIGQTDNWTGIGWNGQPSIIKWSDETRTHMNLYDELKTKENFTEVIYGGLDRTIHFYDLETGKPSRPVIKVPSSIKGSVTIDPRGYPLLYVGQGINTVNGKYVKMGYHIFSLIDGKELLFINGRDAFAYLGWGAFDGNPLIDAKSDTMILPGENSLIYVVKLNTNYDKTTGSITLSPEITRLRTTTYSKAGGIENSIAIYNHYAYYMNNNGIIQCIDLNNLSLVWNYNMGDDCDATLGLEEENNKIMLYAGSEVDRQRKNGPAYARKIDGFTGKIIWEYACNCIYDANVNGGLLSSPIIGKNSISNIVIFNFSKVTTSLNGKMVALDKEKGTVIWEKDMPYYSWSSPVAVYSTTGKAYIVFCNAVGQVLLIDALTGETLYTLNTGGGNIEGSPAVFNNKIVIGTRGKRIYCIEIK